MERELETHQLHPTSNYDNGIIYSIGRVLLVAITGPINKTLYNNSYVHLQ